MTPFAWLIIFFFILLILCLVVYFLVVRAFYWGDKHEGPKLKGQDRETRPRQ